jgi:hypothetical protein
LNYQITTDCRPNSINNERSYDLGTCPFQQLTTEFLLKLEQSHESADKG